MEYNDTNLLALDRQGLSYTQIGAALGVSRSVIAGRIRRIRQGIKASPVRVVPIPREPGVNPAGKTRDYTPAPAPRFVARLAPNRNTIGSSHRNAVSLTKTEMYEMLRKAVENTAQLSTEGNPT